MDIQHALDYLRRQDEIFKKKPDLKNINKYGYQCLQELSAYISVCRFGNLDIFENLTGKLSRKTKKDIESFRESERSEFKQSELFA
jgi:hypothetical protein